MRVMRVAACLLLAGCAGPSRSMRKVVQLQAAQDLGCLPAGVRVTTLGGDSLYLAEGCGRRSTYRTTDGVARLLAEPATDLPDAVGPPPL